MRGQNSGVTLIELMVTISIVAILVAVAAPSVSAMVKNNRLATSANDLMVDLMLARSEAAKRGMRVAVCVSNSGTACAGTDWKAGRIVFVDRGTAVIAQDDLLRVTTTLSSGITLQANKADNTALNIFQYRPKGMTSELGTITFRLCDDRSGNVGRTITINATGRATLTKNTSCP